MYHVLATEKYANEPASRVPLKAVWEGFKENTTAHGVPHINRSRGAIKTGFWISMTLACLGGLSYNAYLLTDTFFDYGVNVKVEVKHQTQLTFPAVTVCNHNPVRKSRLMKTPKLKDIMYPPEPTQLRRKRDAFTDPVSPGITVDLDSKLGIKPGIQLGLKTTSLTSPTVTNPGGAETTVGADPNPDSKPGVTDKQMSTTTPRSLKTLVTGVVKQIGFPEGDRKLPDGRKQRKPLHTRLQVQKVMADVNMEEKIGLGHQLGDFIVDCTYGGYECFINVSSFSSFYNEMYGNCFTFNSGWDGQDLELSFKAGPQYGLKLIFNIDQDEYVGDLAEAAGVRVVVHPQERMPFPEDEGLSISPGMMTNVGVKMLQVTRKGGRYGNCSSTDDASMETSLRRDVFAEYYPVSYTATACYKTCYQKEVITRCQCFDSQYPGYGLAFGHVNSSSCDPSNDTEVGCMHEVTQDYRTGNLPCSCPMPCSETTYTKETSAVLWPSADYRGALFEALAGNAKIKQILDFKENPDKYKENLVKLVVYYQEFNYESIYEVAAYESGQFVSDIGGILGLFIGFSIMTVVEFLELGFDLIFVSWARALSRPSSERSPQPTFNAAVVTGSTFGVNWAMTLPPTYRYTAPPDKTVAGAGTAF